MAKKTKKTKAKTKTVKPAETIDKPVKTSTVSVPGNTW
jgi:hypothetical protein